VMPRRGSVEALDRAKGYSMRDNNRPRELGRPRGGEADAPSNGRTSRSSLPRGGEGCGFAVVAGVRGFLVARGARELFFPVVAGKWLARVELERDAVAACLAVDVAVLIGGHVVSFYGWCGSAGVLADRRAISSITVVLFASITARTSSTSCGCNRGRTPASAAMQWGKLSWCARNRRMISRVSRLYTSTAGSSIDVFGAIASADRS
jgi:hypothetical protein